MTLVRNLLSIVILAGLLAACGVRGEPEAPSGPKPDKNRPIVLDKLI
jgi:predicted small lipoprotein YifL